jgi:hypothetical protein
VEKEVLEAILAALEAQKAEINELRALVKAHDGGIGELIEALYGQHDQEMFGAFQERHGSKFDPVLEIMKAIKGEEYDLTRHVYDTSIQDSENEGYSEDELVDEALKNIVENLNMLKAVVPEAAQPAVEEAEQAVQEAAIVAESAEAGIPEVEAPAAEPPAAESPKEEVIETVAEQTDADGDSPEDEDEMLQEAWEKSSGRGYVSR